MRSVFVWLLCAVFFAPSLAQAQQTAEDMVSNCKEVAEAKTSGDTVMVTTDFSSGLCLGAFMSFQSAMRYATNTNVDGSKSKYARRMFGVCPPAGGSLTQLVRVFLAYAARHPEGACPAAS